MSLFTQALSIAAKTMDSDIPEEALAGVLFMGTFMIIGTGCYIF